MIPGEDPLGPDPFSAWTEVFNLADPIAKRRQDFERNWWVPQLRWQLARLLRENGWSEELLDRLVDKAMEADGIQQLIDADFARTCPRKLN